LWNLLCPPSPNYPEIPWPERLTRNSAIDLEGSVLLYRHRNTEEGDTCSDCARSAARPEAMDRSHSGHAETGTPRGEHRSSWSRTYLWRPSWHRWRLFMMKVQGTRLPKDHMKLIDRWGSRNSNMQVTNGPTYWGAHSSRRPTRIRRKRRSRTGVSVRVVWQIGSGCARVGIKSSDWRPGRAKRVGRDTVCLCRILGPRTAVSWRLANPRGNLWTCYQPRWRIVTSTYQDGHISSYISDLHSNN